MNHPYNDKIELSRSLGLFSATMIGVGAMIGAGIFVLTGIAAGTAGPSLFLVFLLNGFVTLLTAMSYAELGSAIPEAGGGYLWIRKSLSRAQGFLSGWMSWFAHAVAGSLYALGFGAYFGYLLSSMDINLPLEAEIMKKFLSIFIVGIFVYFNYKGASEMGIAENIVTIAKLLIIFLFILSGLGVMFRTPESMENFRNFMPNGLSGMIMAMGLTFIAFEGYEIIVQSGEELKNPKRNIPRAIFLSLMIVIPIYILVAIVSIGAIHPEGMETWEYLGKYKEIGLLKAAEQFMPHGGILLLIGGLLSTMSALNATIFSSTRVSFAMGRSFNLPLIFSRIHPVNRTPYSALIISAFLIVFMAISLPIEDVASAADIMFLLLFIQVNIAAIVMRREMSSKLEYGFKTPLFPYTQYIAILTLVFLAIYMYFLSPVAWIITVIWIAAGYLAYTKYGAEKEEIERGKVLRDMSPQEYRVVVSIKDRNMLKPLIKIAAGIAKSQRSDVVALNVVEMPYQTFLKSGKKFLRDGENLLNMAEKEIKRYRVPMRKKICISHDPADAIINFVTKGKSNVLIMGWSGEVYRDKVRRSIPQRVMKNVHCNVCIVKPHKLDKISRILVPLTLRLEDDLFRVKIAKSISETFGSKIDAVIIDSDGLGSKEIQDYMKNIKNFGIGIKKIRNKSIENALINESKEYDIMIIGPSREWIVEEILFGSIQDRIANKANCTVILAKQPEHRVESRLNLLVDRVLNFIDIK